jgi:hypothetical protein
MPPVAYRDGFENGLVEARLWARRQIEDRQVSFSGDAAEGRSSIVITVTDGGGGADCDTPCQRAELRQHGALRPVHGEDVWQGFSFKMSGDIPEAGSVRTVIGQWKAPGDVSPFLAQRFDNGVFHITVQDGDRRMTIAAAKGDPDRLMAFQRLVAELASAPGFGDATLAALRHGGAAADSVLAALFAGWAGHADPGGGAALFREFSFIQELERYARTPSIVLDPPTPEALPDPALGWVRMAYRLKGGRTDNLVGPIGRGEVEVWVDGAHVVTARGNLGYRLTAPPDEPTLYFKFGIYRNILPGTMRYHFDDFRQGTRRIDVM